MRTARKIGLLTVGLLGATAVLAQPVPLGDAQEKPLLPSGISSLSVKLNASVVYLFKDPDGTEASHFVGDFVLSLGEGKVQTLRAKEAIVWLENRELEGRSYRALQVFLWRDAEVVEVAGTVTSGPALFVTLSTFADVELDADDVAMGAGGDPTTNEVYRQGLSIRKALTEGRVAGSDAAVALQVFDPSGSVAGRAKPKPRPIVHFQSPGTVSMEQTEGRRRLVITGGIYVSRGVAGEEEFLEISADNAVVFFVPEGATPQPGGAPAGGLGGRPESLAQPAERREAERASPDRQLMATAFGNLEVEGTYLEGDVRMSQGVHSLRASRLYYDFVQERALLLDAVAKTLLVQRNVPIYLRADAIRQLSRTEYTAENAVLTTSEFHTPHYHIGASEVRLINRTPPEPGRAVAGIRAGSFEIRQATFNISGRPVLYWPYMKGSVDTSETAIRSVRTGFSDDFGLELETKWHLFNLLGLQKPDGVDATLRTDYFSERGPAIGVESDYKRERYFGEFKSYLLADDGHDSLGRNREETSPHDVRGRFLLRHRQYLEDDWQVSLELSYLSDRDFLEEFAESEFDNGKEQETLLYLKKQRDNWAFAALLQYRLMDFLTQTERLPDLAYFRLGEPLGRGITWYTENRLGLVRYRSADPTFWQLLRDGEPIDSGAVGRADSRHEFGLPADVGPWRVVPFAAGRGTAWDDSPESGGLMRAYGMVGARGSVYLSKTFPDVQSTLFDLHGIRHVVKQDWVAWTSGDGTDPHELYPFDPTVEEIHATDGAVVGLRQRFQTKRGPENAQRTVDVFTHDLEIGAFNNADGDALTNGYASFSRPENSVPRNFVNTSTIYRVNDRTSLLSELNYDMNDGEVDILNASMAVERSPRLSYLIGYRFIEEEDSNLLGLDVNYRLTEKHTLALRELFDLERGETLDFTVALIRRFPRWYSALSFELDQAEDDFGVSLSVWPEGLPQAAIGSRRFTGLANTTRITND
ncbi:MAG: LPS assembly protein LptD [Planctomycetota bacterium]